VGGVQAAAHHLGSGGERQRVGEAVLRPERQPEDPVRRREVVAPEWRDADRGVPVRGGDRTTPDESCHRPVVGCTV
jgi:hypothetical protein